MFLLIGYTPGVDVTSISKLLKKCGAAILPGELTADGSQSISAQLDKKIAHVDESKRLTVLGAVPAEQLQELGSRFEEHKVKLLALYSNPGACFVGGREDDTDFLEVIDDWKSSAESLMQAHRKVGKGSLLADASSALLNPKEFIEVCEAYQGMPLSADSLELSFEQVNVGIETLVAAQLASADSRVKTLLQELEASSPPTGRNGELVDKGMLAALSRLRKLKEAEKKVDALEIENRQASKALQELRQELAETREQLAASKRDLQSKAGLKGSLEAAEKKKSELESEIETLRTNQEEYKSENELLILQLHQVQEELEEYFLESQPIRVECDQLRKNNEKLAKRIRSRERDLEATRRSISWRITAPLRAVTGPVFALRQRKSPRQLTHEKPSNK